MEHTGPCLDPAKIDDFEVRRLSHLDLLDLIMILLEEAAERDLLRYSVEDGDANVIEEPTDFGHFAEEDGKLHLVAWLEPWDSDCPAKKLCERYGVVPMGESITPMAREAVTEMARHATSITRHAVDEREAIRKAQARERSKRYRERSKNARDEG